MKVLLKIFLIIIIILAVIITITDYIGSREIEALIMQGVAANLSDKEIKAVANYISGLN